MFKHSRFVFLSGVLLFVLLLSLARPMAAYADDGVPPPPATGEPAQPPAEEDEPEAAPPPAEESGPPLTDAPVVQETVSTEAPAATEVSVEEADGVSPIAENEGEEVSEEPGAIEELTVGEVIEATPEGTQVVVLDESGEALPLVSTEAAEIVATADPMWCPVIAGARTLPGGAGCSLNFPSPQALIDDMDVIDPQTPGLGLYERPGIIYFTADLTAPGNPFILIRGGLDDDLGSPELYAADYDALKGYDLILQGGWSGVNGDTNFTQTNFGANPVQIGTDTNPWVGSVTINNITITGTADTGLTVYTQGDINLDHVTANKNTFIGADLDSAGNINIHSSTFGEDAGSRNNFAGLRTSAAGSTTLVDVTASGNGIWGAILSNPTGFGGAITVSESHFDGNVGSGLLVGANSSITIFKVTASDNGGFTLAGGAIFMGAGPVTVTESHFDRNDLGGLWVQSSSNVSLSGVTANDNRSFGAMLLNAAGNVWVSDSNFDWNADTVFPDPGFGLFVDSPGNVSLNAVSASNNALGYGVNIGAVSDIVIGNSIFNGNGLDGAWLRTFENATVVCSQFQNNDGIGVDGFGVDGTFTLNDVIFGGNGIDYDGTPVFMSGGCGCDTATGGHGQKKQDVVLYIIIGQTQDQLPGTLDGSHGFVSALQVLLTAEGQKASNLTIMLSFPIPEGMQDAKLAVMFWDGSGWVAVPGGAVMNGYFVITVSQPGFYALVSQ